MREKFTTLALPDTVLTWLAMAPLGARLDEKSSPAA
jgi:hypothetical protein